MANEVDDIVQNIVLTGNEEVAEAFNKIQEAGANAFEALGRSVEHSVFSFQGLVTAVAGIAASVAIVGVGLFKFTESINEGTSSLKDLADQTGSTTEEISGLQAAFAAGGVGPGQMEQAFKRLSVSIQQSWAEIKTSSRESADKLAGDALAVQSATFGVIDAQKKLGDTVRDQALQQRSNANSVSEARLRLAELNGRDVSDQRAALQISQARLGLEQARKKQADDIATAEEDQKKAAIAAEQAQLALNQARRKESDDRKNDITNVIDAVKKTAEGDKSALSNVNASADNIAKGIIGASAQAQHAIGELRGDITDLSSPGPGVKETFLEIGRVLQNIDDPALKTAVAFRLLGRSISQDFLNVLSDPGKMKEFQERVHDLGLEVDETDKKVSEKFRSSLFTLENDIQLIATKIATAFGPGLTTAIQAIDDAILRNKDTFTQYADIIGGKVSETIGSFVRVLSGVPDAARDQWLSDYIDKLSAFGSALANAAGLVTSLLSAIVSGADKIANVLNSAFGTNLNGIDIIFAAWVAKIVASFGAIQAAATAVATGVEVGLAPVLAILGLISAAVYTVVKAWSALSDAFSLQGQTSHLDAMLEGTQKRLQAIAEFMSGDFKKGIEDWKAADAKQAAAEKTIDDVDKQVNEGRRRRQAELAKNTSDGTKNEVTDHKSSLTQIDKDHKDSIDNRINETKRLTEANKQNDVTQRPIAEQEKQAQTQPQIQPQLGVKPQPDGSFIDKNGTRVFPGSESSGGSVGPTIGSNIAQAVSRQLGIPLSAVSLFGGMLRFGNAGVVHGFQSGEAEVIHPPGFQQPSSQSQPPRDPRDTIGRIVPNPSPRFVDADQIEKNLGLDKIEEGVEKGVQRGLHDDVSASDRQNGFGPTQIPPGGPENLPPTPGNFPTPPSPAPLAPELQPFKGLTDIGDKLTGAFDGIVSKAQDLFGSASRSPVEGSSLSDTTFQSLSQGIQGLINAITSQGHPQDGQSHESGQDTPPVQDLSSLTDAAQTAASGLSDVGGSLSSLDGAAQSAAAALASIRASSGDSSVVTAAGGGHIRGAGSETSDSIPALLSHNEYVHQAAAVRHYGVDFMHAINSMQFPRFNAGGLVGLLSPRLPRFSGGGLASSTPQSSAPHLGTLDLRTDAGTARVHVDKPAIAQLQRIATTNRITSTSKRKPGFVS